MKRRLTAFGSAHPFVLNLPKEAPLLPPLLDCMLNTRLGPRYVHEKTISVSQLIEGYVPDVNSLLRVIAEAQTPEQRGAAAMTCLLHPACPKESNADCINTIVQNYKPHTNSWYLRAAGAALEPLIVADDLAAIEGMGSLLRAGSGDFNARFGLNRVFGRLRQRSKAPVSEYGIAKF